MADSGMAIADFVRSTTALHKRLVAEYSVAKDNSETAGQTPSLKLDTQDVDTLLREFEGHGNRLAAYRHDGKASIERESMDALASLGRACWKVSQDIVLRLRRCSKVSIVQAFPPRDVEALGSCILELKDRWLSLRPATE